jgi:hypothetical protein
LDTSRKHFRVLENALSSTFESTTHSTHSTHSTALLSSLGIELPLAESKNAVDFTSDN